jgi:probable phosphoglycerate mutase
VNVARIAGGPKGDTGLTARGVEQATRLRDRFTREAARADAVYTSPLLRSLQTAEIAGVPLGHTPRVEADLEELRLGEADGMHLDEVVARFGRPDFRGQPERPVCPGAESIADLLARTARTLTRIARAHTGETVIIFTHGGVIDGAFNAFMRLPLERLPDVDFATAHTSLSSWSERAFADRWRLDFYNDHAHLIDPP